jgi:hypothetical protein
MTIQYADKAELYISSFPPAHAADHKGLNWLLSHTLPIKIIWLPLLINNGYD